MRKMCRVEGGEKKNGCSVSRRGLGSTEGDQKLYEKSKIKDKKMMNIRERGIVGER